MLKRSSMALALLVSVSMSAMLGGCTANPLPNSTSTSSAANTIATVAAVVTAAEQWMQLETASGLLKGSTASTVAADVSKAQAALTDLQAAYTAYQSLASAGNQATFAAKTKIVLSVLASLNSDLVASGVEHASLGGQINAVIVSIELLLTLTAGPAQ
jgi:hypothetical protein